MNKKKKTIIIVSIIILLILVLISTIYLLNKSKKTESGTSVYENVDSNLSKTVVLSEADNELISVLKNVDIYLQNFTITEDVATQEQFMFLISIGGVEDAKTSITLKEYISNIYEARKYTDDNGKTTYLFDIELVDKANLLVNKRAIIMVSDEAIKYINLNLHDINFTNEIFTKDTLNSFALIEAFYGSYFTSICTQVSNTWEKATTFENVNYENIWNNI